MSRCSECGVLGFCCADCGIAPWNQDQPYLWSTAETAFRYLLRMRRWIASAGLPPALRASIRDLSRLCKHEINFRYVNLTSYGYGYAGWKGSRF